MSLDDLQAIGMGAGGSGIMFGLAYFFAKVFGSGKERMDDAQVKTKALEANYQASLEALKDQISGLNAQIVGLHDQLQRAWGECANLRQSWVADFTTHERTRDKVEEDKSAALIREAIATGENKLLRQEIMVLNRENSRLLGMVPTPNVYAQGYLDIPPDKPKEEGNDHGTQPTQS